MIKPDNLCEYTTHPMYKRWLTMKNRCSNPNNPSYVNYGGRGIKVCKEWDKNFIEFLSDVGGSSPFPDGSLDRIDNDGDYCPTNVRWSTKQQQMRNSRHNVLYTMDGITKTRTEWAEEYGINPATFTWRMNHGWDMKEALTRKPLPVGNNAPCRK